MKFTKQKCGKPVQVAAGDRVFVILWMCNGNGTGDSVLMEGRQHAFLGPQLCALWAGSCVAVPESHTLLVL